MKYKVTAHYNWGILSLVTESKKQALDFWEDKVSDSSSSIGGSIEIDGVQLNPDETREFTKGCTINNRMN